MFLDILRDRAKKSSLPFLLININEGPLTLEVSVEVCVAR